MSDKKYTPILPFEDSSFENYTTYNKINYVRDIDLTEKTFIDCHSDNLIKYYSTLTADAVKIGGD